MRDGQADMKWADGSTYSGDVVAAQMDGVGLLTTAEGDRFQGQWATDRLNGHGVVAWANGDHYDGEWRDGIQNGAFLPVPVARRPHAEFQLLKPLPHAGEVGLDIGDEHLELV